MMTTAAWPAWLKISGIAIVSYGLSCVYWPLGPIWFGLWLQAIASEATKERKARESADRMSSINRARGEQSDDQPRVN